MILQRKIIMTFPKKVNYVEHKTKQKKKEKIIATATMLYINILYIVYTHVIFCLVVVM